MTTKIQKMLHNIFFIYANLEYFFYFAAEKMP